jgi:hypothetical protein
MAVNDTYFFKVTGQLRGVQYVHTLHFRALSLPVGGADEQQALIDNWQTGSQALWLAAHTSDYSMQTVSVQKICGGPPLPAPTVEATSLVGTRSSPIGEPLSPWLCVRANEGTNLAGKSRHGAFYFSGGWEDDVNQDTIRTGWLTPITAYCTGLVVKYGLNGTDADWKLVVHSRKLAKVPGTQCQDSSAVVRSITPTPRLTTNRSRRA